MDLVKSHISGQPFLYPVPHLPTYSSILLRISRGFSSGCKVYIRPSKDVASTEIRLAAAPTGPSSTHRTGPASFFPPPTRTKPSWDNWCSLDISLDLLLLPDLLLSSTPWTQRHRWHFWFWLWRWQASARLFTSKAAWTKTTSCSARRRTCPTVCWGWWDANIPKSV